MKCEIKAKNVKYRLSHSKRQKRNRTNWKISVKPDSVRLALPNTVKQDLGEVGIFHQALPLPEIKRRQKKTGLIHGSEDEMGRINSNQFYSNSIIISVLSQIKT